MRFIFIYQLEIIGKQKFHLEMFSVTYKFQITIFFFLKKCIKPCISIKYFFDFYNCSFLFFKLIFDLEIENGFNLLKKENLPIFQIVFSGKGRDEEFKHLEFLIERIYIPWISCQK